MDRPEPLVAAADVVAHRFPDATAAFLAGSVLTERRTETSDLDVVVVLVGRPAPYRETVRHDGWPVELFVLPSLLCGAAGISTPGHAERRCW